MNANTQAIEFYLSVHSLNVSTLHYTSNHGSPTGARCARSLEIDGLGPRSDRFFKRRRRGAAPRSGPLQYKTPKINASAKRLNAYTTNSKETNGNSRRACMIFRYLQSSKTDKLNINKTVACGEVRRSPPSLPKAESHGEPRPVCYAIPER